MGSHCLGRKQCTNTPTYGLSVEDKPTHCSSHKTNQMVEYKWCTHCRSAFAQAKHNWYCFECFMYLNI